MVKLGEIYKNTKQSAVAHTFWNTSEVKDLKDPYNPLLNCTFSVLSGFLNILTSVVTCRLCCLQFLRIPTHIEGSPKQNIALLVVCVKCLVLQFHVFCARSLISVIWT